MLENKFRRELRSFYALTIMNLAFGGIAMALGISYARACKDIVMRGSEISIHDDAVVDL